MAITAKKRETGFKKYVGYFEGEVVAVNPDLDELVALGINTEKEPEYLKDVEDTVTDKNGDETTKEIKQLTVVFLIRDKKTKQIHNVRFFLKDKLSISIPKGKTQFINSQGNSSWASDESKLSKFMTDGGKTVRIAHVGEAELFEFLRTWLNGADFGVDGELTLDWKQLMKGSVKEIREFFGTEYPGTILCPATVRVTDDQKEYQQIYAKGIARGYLMKEVLLKEANGSFNEAYKDKVRALKAENKKLTAFEKAVFALVDKEWGCKDNYHLGTLKEYTAESDFVNTDEVVPEEKELVDDDLSF